ncbi:MAG: hypothetical protein ACJ75S_02190, partial [Solirubrobacterales bacterium]
MTTSRTNCRISSSTFRGDGRGIGSGSHSGRVSGSFSRLRRFAGAGAGTGTGTGTRWPQLQRGSAISSANSAGRDRVGVGRRLVLGGRAGVLE